MERSVMTVSAPMRPTTLIPTNRRRATQQGQPGNYAMERSVMTVSDPM